MSDNSGTACDLELLPGFRYSAVIDARADEAGDDRDHLQMLGDVSTAPLHQLEVSLWADSGVFDDGRIETGTFALAGAEIDYSTCGVCVALRATYDPVLDIEEHLLVAQSGTVRIDSIDDDLAGELIDVVLREIDPDTDELIPGGCSTTISTTFSAELDRGGGGNNGGGGGFGGF